MTAARQRLRIYIGDVHGCGDELDDMLDALQFDPARHSLRFVGDLVNRGPASARVVRRAIQLKAECVLGNHDLHLLGLASGARRSRESDTLDRLLAADDAPALLEWLRERPMILVDRDVIMVHAALHPRWGDPVAAAATLQRIVRSRPDPLVDPSVDFAARVRWCAADGRRPPRSLEGGNSPGTPYAAWYRWYRGDRTVVFGHWARQGLVQEPRVRGLDTGCVYGGRLTAWIAEEDRLVSVPARRTYQTPR